MTSIADKKVTHGTPKIHKTYELLPKFRPIIDTTGSPYHGVGKFLSSLLNPLTQNDFTVKDSFDAATRIKDIPTELFEEEYVYVSFDVESLFTNVPLKETVDIILDRVYNNNQIQTKLSKRSLKKLILDSCRKTTFSFNSVLYEQVDGVSMGACLGPVLANIILTELEKVKVQPLIDSGLLKFYIRYVDDTLVLIKRKDLEYVRNQLNTFHPNLKFTVDEFLEGDIHFLDLLIKKNSTSIYYKDTHTAQYTNFDSYAPWTLRTAWIKSLFHRARTICSTKELFKEQLEKINRFMSWNGFPKHVRKSLINRLQKGCKMNPIPRDIDVQNIWFNIPYAGAKGEFLVKSLVRKLRRYLKKDVRIITRYRNKKLSMFCSTKDKIPFGQRSNVIYEIDCPGCGGKYIGKTERCLSLRLTEHGTRNDQPMFRHLKECSKFIDYTKMFSMNEDPDFISFDNHLLNAVLHNSKILDFNMYNFKWDQLCFLESFYIKHRKPGLNHGIKASKDFTLFN